MLSRVAERLYWMARYIERAENTARLVNVYRELMLDLPQGVGLQWSQLVDITGVEDFDTRYKRASENNVLRFMLSDTSNPGSVISALSYARENMRTTRDLVPTEGWESVNELYLFARRKFTGRKLPSGLHEVLSQVVGQCQQITGLLAGTMSYGDPFRFVLLGRSLERADMTTRIVDVGSATLIAPGEEIDRLESRLWMNVLRALSAYQMYRQNVRRRVRGRETRAYLLQDENFPRAVAHCLNRMQANLGALPRNEAAMLAVSRARRSLIENSVADLSGEPLHEFIDSLQAALGEAHDQIAAAWFVLELDAAI